MWIQLVKLLLLSRVARQHSTMLDDANFVGMEMTRQVLNALDFGRFASAAPRLMIAKQ